jgi:hypothetical protein
MLERRVKLLGKDHGKGGVDTLPHLDLRDCESDLAVGLDAHERVRREVRVRLRGEHSVEPGKGEAEDEAAACGDCRLHERATGEPLGREDRGHGSVSIRPSRRLA